MVWQFARPWRVHHQHGSVTTAEPVEAQRFVVVFIPEISRRSGPLQFPKDQNWSHRPALKGRGFRRAVKAAKHWALASGGVSSEREAIRVTSYR